MEDPERNEKIAVMVVVRGVWDWLNEVSWLVLLLWILQLICWLAVFDCRMWNAATAVTRLEHWEGFLWRHVVIITCTCHIGTCTLCRRNYLSGDGKWFWMSRNFSECRKEEIHIIFWLSNTACNMKVHPHINLKTNVPRMGEMRNKCKRLVE